MTDRIRIVSNGKVSGTQVLMPDGTSMPNVLAIEILNLHADHCGEMVQARVTLTNVELDVSADANIGAEA